MEGTPLWGRVEIQTKKKKRCPRSQSGQPGPSCGWLPPLPKTLRGSQSCRGAAWLTLLPIVYSEGVIHKNSRTTSLFPSLRSLLVLVPPSPLSSIKAGELKLCLLKELGRLGCGRERRQMVAGEEKSLLGLPGVSGSLAPSPSVPVQPPFPRWPRGAGYLCPPSCEVTL